MLSGCSKLISSYPRALGFNKPISLFQSFLRGYKVEASELKAGDVIDHKSKLLEVMKIQHNFGAQRAASMQVELKDVRTGNKALERFRVAENVEIVELNWIKTYFEKKDEEGNYVFFLDEDEDKTILLPTNFLHNEIPWLKPGLPFDVRMTEENEPLAYRWRERHAIYKVKKTNPVPGTISAGKSRPAELYNGQIVNIPSHIDPDTWIKIDLYTKEFISKAEAPPPDEDDE